MCFTTASLPTPPCVFPGAFLGLSFGEEGVVPIQVSSLRDQLSLLVQVVFTIQVSEDEMILQSTSLFQAIFQSPREHLT